MTQRIGVDRGSPGAFIYDIPVPKNGRYLVRLYFAELISGASPDHPDGAGQRDFNVSAEGETKLSDYDIFSEVGPLTAAVKQFTVDVQDGSLTLRFWGGKTSRSSPRSRSTTRRIRTKPATAAKTRRIAQARRSQTSIAARRSRAARGRRAAPETPDSSTPVMNVMV